MTTATVLDAIPAVGTELRCPLCPQTWTAPTARYAPGVAQALGMSAGGLAEAHLYQERVGLEREMERHLAKHKPIEWITALNDMRAAWAASLNTIRELTDEIRRTA